MKNRISLWTVCALFVIALMAPQANAACNAATLTGGWAYLMQDNVFILQPLSVPALLAEAGIFTFDGVGGFTLTDTRSAIGEPVLHLETSQGNYFVNADCTGELILHRHDPPNFEFFGGGQLVHISFKLGPGNTVAILAANDPNWLVFVTPSNSSCTPSPTPGPQCNTFVPFYVGVLSKQ